MDKSTVELELWLEGILFEWWMESMWERERIALWLDVYAPSRPPSRVYTPRLVFCQASTQTRIGVIDVIRITLSGRIVSSLHSLYTISSLAYLNSSRTWSNPHWSILDSHPIQFLPSFLPVFLRGIGIIRSPVINSISCGGRKKGLTLSIAWYPHPRAFWLDRIDRRKNFRSCLSQLFELEELVWREDLVQCGQYSQWCWKCCLETCLWKMIMEECKSRHWYRVLLIYVLIRIIDSLNQASSLARTQSWSEMFNQNQTKFASTPPLIDWEDHLKQEDRFFCWEFTSESSCPRPNFVCESNLTFVVVYMYIPLP